MLHASEFRINLKSSLKTLNAYAPLEQVPAHSVRSKSHCLFFSLRMNFQTSATTLRQQSKAFLSDMANDPRWALTDMDFQTRWTEIQKEIEATGTYTHSEKELTFGAQWAWRNSNRCIGRHMWRSLKVHDARSAQENKDIVHALGQHMETAWNDGQIQSLITIFAPRHPRRLMEPDPVRIGNGQLIRYAGFKQSDGSVQGDPASVALTQHMLDQGWRPENRHAFVPLPWSIWTEDEEHPPEDVFAKCPQWLHEVELTHPEWPGFAELALKWYAIPAISEMALVIGGITYPCAPFNGWYMGTEIGARNLADEDRYNVLPAVAKCIGLDTSSPRNLWKDRALVELNRAVLHSFDDAGITMGDHHELGAQFEKFCKVEARGGRAVTGDWSWLNPPISGPSTPQFHRAFDGRVSPHTNYFYQSSAAEDAKARKRGAKNGSTPSADPYDLEHHHATPRCPFGHG